MTKVYEDDEYCGYCDRYTRQTITDSEHERDSSGDKQECSECGWVYWGLTGKWEAPYK